MNKKLSIIEKNQLDELRRAKFELLNKGNFRYIHRKMKISLDEVKRMDVSDDEKKVIIKKYLDDLINNRV